MAVCVSALEAELTKALEDFAQLEQRNGQLAEQLSGLKEKVSIRLWGKVVKNDPPAWHIHGSMKCIEYVSMTN